MQAAAASQVPSCYDTITIVLYYYILPIYFYTTIPYRIPLVRTRMPDLLRVRLLSARRSISTPSPFTPSSKTVHTPSLYPPGHACPTCCA